MGRALLTVFAIFATVWPAAAQGVLWAAEATHRVRPDDAPEDANAVWSAADATVRLRAARGESEAFHLVVTAGGSALRGIEVRAGELQAVDGPGVLSGDSLFLYREAFFHVTEISDLWGQARLGETGQVPDALIPFVDPYGSGREIGVPFDVGAGRSQPLFVLVEVPVDAAAGVYRTTLDLVRRGSGRALGAVTFELEVLDVNLPSRPAFRAFFNLDAETLAELHGNPGAGRLRTLERNALTELARRRISPGYVYPKVPSYDNEEGFDWSDAEDEWRHWLDTWQGAVVNVGFIYDDAEGTYRIRKKNGAPYTRANLTPGSHFDREAKRYYSRLFDDLEARGWAGRAVAFLGEDDRGALADEPYNVGAAAYDRLRAWAEIFRHPEAGDAEKTFPFVVAADSLYPSASYADLRGSVDVWDQYVDEVDTNAAAYADRRTAFGEEVWLVANGYNDFIDYPSIYPRSIGFFAWKTGATGLEHWDTLAWFDAGENLVSPWQPSNLTPVWGWGAGALMWPGEDIERRGIRIDGPLPSLRLELNRQAFEDYDLLALLASSGGDGPALASAIATAAVPDRLYDGLDVGRGHFERSRDAVLDLLVSGGAARTITGRTRRPGGKSLAGALVGTETFAAVTGEDGTFRLTLPAGAVALRATADGYRDATVEVPAGEESADVVLEPLPLKRRGLYGSFERSANLWVGEGADVSLSGAHVRHGKRAMRVLFKASAEESAVYPDTGVRPRNWSAFDAFVMEVYNASPYLAELDVDLYDASGGASYHVVYANPDSWTTVRLPVASMTLDTSKVDEIEIYVDAPGRGNKEIHFDRMHLVRDDE